jgi:PAS domain S-box-containing protein
MGRKRKQETPEQGQVPVEELEELVRKRTKELEKANEALQAQIAERAKVETQLQDSRSYLDRIINSIPDPVFVKDRKHRWMMLNDAYCRFMGYERTELIGKSDVDFFPEQEARIFWDMDEVVFTTGQDNMNEEHFTDSRGVTHTIVTKKTLVTELPGEPFIVGVIRDITERKELEEEREKLVCELKGALVEIKTLSGLLPLCSYCKKIRNDKGYWEKLEAYLGKHSQAEFSHSVCPECFDKYYPGFLTGKGKEF